MVDLKPALCLLFPILRRVLALIISWSHSPSFVSKRKRFIIKGDWTNTIQCFTVDKFTRKESKRDSKRRRSDASELSATSASAVSLESFSSGSSDGSVTVDVSTPKDLWSFQERPPNSKQVRVRPKQMLPRWGRCRVDFPNFSE